MNNHMRLLSTLLATFIASGIGGARAADAPATAKTPPVPLLWKVSDADNSVYLLGSFHMLEPGDYPLSRDVDAAFADAEALVFELPPEEMARRNSACAWRRPRCVPTARNCAAI